MTSPPPATERVALVALTPEARSAIGGADLPITAFPFRVGRDSRGKRAVARVLMDRRRKASRPNNELYLSEYVLVDRQSTCGTIVEGQVVGGKQAGGAVVLHDGDVIIVGTSASRFAFKFRAG